MIRLIAGHCNKSHETQNAPDNKLNLVLFSQHGRVAGEAESEREEETRRDLQVASPEINRRLTPELLDQLFFFVFICDS